MRIFPALSSVFARKVFLVQLSVLSASTWTNAVKLECATTANVSTWTDLSNVFAIPATNFHPTARLASVCLFLL